MPISRTILKASRLFHLYSGVFLAPALLFFAFTGAVQTASLHETTKGSDYKPPKILVELGQLHKKQTLVVPERKSAAARPENPATAAPEAASSRKPAFNPDHIGDHTNQQKHDRIADRDAKPTTPTLEATAPTPPPATQPAPPTAATAPQQKAHNLVPMKVFFLLTALGLFLSTLTGLFMAYKYTHNKLAITATLAVGIAIPLLLLLL